MKHGEPIPPTMETLVTSFAETRVGTPEFCDSSEFHSYRWEIGREFSLTSNRLQSQNNGMKVVRSTGVAFPFHPQVT